MEPLPLDPRAERSIHRGVQNLGAEALEFPILLPEHLARAQVGDAPKWRLLLRLVGHLSLALLSEYRLDGLVRHGDERDAEDDGEDDDGDEKSEHGALLSVRIWRRLRKL
jgi:hypothetical protein